MFILLFFMFFHRYIFYDNPFINYMILYKKMGLLNYHYYHSFIIQINNINNIYNNSYGNIYS